MNQNREFADDPGDGTASEFDPLFLEEVERRLRGMRPVVPDIDLAALVEQAGGRDAPVERSVAGDANRPARRMPEVETIGVRRTRRFLTVAAAWLCGVAMGALAMVAVQRNTLPGAASVGTTEFREEKHGDVTPVPQPDQDKPKSPIRIAVDRVDRNRHVPTVGEATPGRDLAAMLGRMRPEYVETGEVWWTGMFLRAGLDRFGVPRGGVPQAAVAAMDGVDAEANAAAVMETPDLSTRPAPTREQLLREFQRDRSGRVF